MKRKPIRVRRPECFSSDKEADECADCKWQKRCSKLYEFFRNIPTLVEVSAKGSVSLTETDGLEFLIKEMKRVNYRNSAGLRFSPKIKSTVGSILSICTRDGLDPRVYITAQVETIGYWAAKNNKPIYANMLIGPNALRRFNEWMKKNARKYADHQRIKDDSESLVAAETFFAEAYLSSDERAKSIEREVRERFPGWCLKLTRRRPEIRLRAIMRLLSSRSSILPNRIVMKSRSYRWCDLRDFIRTILELGG